jgi:hypothetical protein
MKRLIAAVLLLVSSGVAMAQESNVHNVWQQRGLFNGVHVGEDLPRRTCGGLPPTDVKVYHTVGDGFAAVFTGILWTPAHLRVTCPAPSAQR